MNKPDSETQRPALGDEDGTEEGSGDRSHAADHHHDEGIADNDEVETQIRRLARHLQRAAEPGEEGAEREDHGEQHGLVDAERAHHLAVLRGGADQPSEAGLRQHEIEQQQHDRADDDQEQVVARKVAPEDFDRAAQAGRARPEQVLGAPDPLRGVVDDEHQREGGEQLEQLRRLVDAAQQQHLDQRAEGGHDEAGGDDAAPEAERAADLEGEGGGEIEPQHVEGAVGDVDDAGDAEDQRQAGADEEQARRRGEAVERLKQEGFEGHAVMELLGSIKAIPGNGINASRKLGLLPPPAEVGYIRLRPLLVPNSGKPEFGWGRAGEGGDAFGYVGASSHAPHPQPLPTRGRGAHRARGTVFRQPERNTLTQLLCPSSSTQFIAAAGRSFFTSASGGSTLAPSTYLKSDMVPLPSLSAILPT